MQVINKKFLQSIRLQLDDEGAGEANLDGLENQIQGVHWEPVKWVVTYRNQPQERNILKINRSQQLDEGCGPEGNQKSGRPETGPTPQMKIKSNPFEQQDEGCVPEGNKSNHA